MLSLLRLLSTLHGPANRRSNLELLAKTEELEAVFECAGQLSAVAEIKALKGHLYARCGDTALAIEEMRRAVEIAQAAGDKAGEFFALAQLGKQLAKQSLEEALAVRYQTRRLFNGHLATGLGAAGWQSVLSRQFDVLLIYIGLGEFDQGNPGRAITFLERGIAGLKKCRADEDLIAGLNYLSQVHAATGMFEAAERNLRYAIALQLRDNPSALHPWLGCNHGLLAKTYVEWQQWDRASESMAEAVRISEAAQQVDLITLVRNYQAELLIIGGPRHLDLARAERVLMINLDDSARASLHRSATLSNSLLALLRLKQGRLAEAADRSAEAVECVRAWGNMPALRTEEIYFNHYKVLLALGSETEALSFLERAYRLLQEKGRCLSDKLCKNLFYRRVPLNREILGAYSSRLDPSERNGSNLLRRIV